MSKEGGLGGARALKELLRERLGEIKETGESKQLAANRFQAGSYDQSSKAFQAPGSLEGGR